MHQRPDGTWIETEFVVIGMGKLGAHELNYSSDVDLIYVYASADGETRKAKGNRQASIKPLSNEEYFEMLARSLTKALAEANGGRLGLERIAGGGLAALLTFSPDRIVKA